MSTSESSKLLLRTIGLSAGYGPVPVLSGISIEVEAGRITALLGANGAGKTTLFRALCGAIRSEGEIQIAGQCVRGLRPEQIARRGVGHVPEGRGTFADLTVDENLRVGGFARDNLSGFDDALERVYKWLPRLAERRQQLAGSLSGGEQQMVAIGRALIAQPRSCCWTSPPSASRRASRWRSSTF